jgi:hypothetical protein
MNRLRSLAYVTVGVIAGYLAGSLARSPATRGDKSALDDTQIINALVGENASLTEELEVSRKLIDTLKAERREMRNATADPA